MNEPQKIPALDDELKAVLPPSDRFSQFHLFILRYKKQMGITLLALLGLVIIFFRHESAQNSDFENFQKLQKEWAQSPEKRKEMLESFDAVFHEHPEWLGSWKGSFLQSALIANNQHIASEWRDFLPARLLNTSDLKVQSLDEATKLFLGLSSKTPQESIEAIDHYLFRFKELFDSSKQSYIVFLHLDMLAAKALLLEKAQKREQEVAAWKALLSQLGIKESEIGKALSSAKAESIPWLESFSIGRLRIVDYISYRLKNNFP